MFQKKTSQNFGSQETENATKRSETKRKDIKRKDFKPKAFDNKLILEILHHCPTLLLSSTQYFIIPPPSCPTPALSHSLSDPIRHCLVLTYCTLLCCLGARLPHCCILCHCSAVSLPTTPESTALQSHCLTAQLPHGQLPYILLK
jgi:hypothetical protein